MYAQNQKSQALALFDFDGTLYPHDSFTGFIFYVLKKRHIIWRGLKNSAVDYSLLSQTLSCTSYAPEALLSYV